MSLPTDLSGMDHAGAISLLVAAIIILGLTVCLIVVRRTLRSEIRARHELEERGNRSLARLGVAMASLETGLLVTDRTGHVAYLNAPAESMTGWTAESASGRLLRDLAREKAAVPLVGPRAADTVPPADREAPKDSAMQQATEILIAAGDGVRKLQDWAAELALSSGTSLNHVALIFRDHRDAVPQPSMKRSWASLQHKLEAEKWRMREANRLKSRFVANLSHDLRTPLNAIIGFADLLRAGTVPPDSPKRSVFAGRIAASGRQLLEFINDILNLSKIDAGDMEFHTAPVRLPELIAAVVDAAQETYADKRVAFSQDVDPALIDLLLDRECLRQVLQVFVRSAAQLTIAGGRVRVTGTAEGPAHLRVEVETSNMSAGEAEFSLLLNEFHPLAGRYSKRPQDMYLKLLVARRLIEAQGGSIGLRRSLDGGCTFELVLNRIHGTDIPSAGYRSPLREAPNGRRMLVIGELARDRANYPQEPSETGYEIDVACTAEDAVRRANQRCYDALALDLPLSDPSGFQILKIIRSAGLSQRTPVVRVGASTADRRRATFAVANILSKPIDLEEVANALGPFLWQWPRMARMMVIDDDPMALDLMCATLRGLGVDCTGVSDPRRILDEMDMRRPDALVVDLVMPEVDGVAVLEMLRSSKAWRDIPVFLWTSLPLTAEDIAILRSSGHLISSNGGATLGALPHLHDRSA